MVNFVEFSSMRDFLLNFDLGHNWELLSLNFGVFDFNFNIMYVKYVFYIDGILF